MCRCRRNTVVVRLAGMANERDRNVNGAAVSRYLHRKKASLLKEDARAPPIVVIVHGEEHHGDQNC